MYLACKCLNILIKSSSKELSFQELESLPLPSLEEKDDFFNNVAIMHEIQNITQEQSGLVEVRNVGSWSVHQCLNCMGYSHAIGKGHELSGLILVNKNAIISEQEIANLKASPDYSPVFRIVIDHTKTEELDPLEVPLKVPVSQLSNPLRFALGNLEKQLDEAIQQQAKLIEERIQAFTKEQYKVLEQFRERAHAEHAHLARLICDGDHGSTNSSKFPKTTHISSSTQSRQIFSDVPDATISRKSLGERLVNESGKQLRNNIHVNGRNHNSQTQVNDNNYEEELFMLEGMEDNSSSKLHHFSEQESDTDDSGNEGIHLPRSRRSGHSALARSLPVTVPAFQSFGQRDIDQEDDYEISKDPMDPNNIRASIKALAKSVHGDTVFGDLPRPRFSTQI